MRMVHLMFLAFVGGLIFIISRPEVNGRQAQEEESRYEKVSPSTFKIQMDIQSDEERPVADILWFQKAADVAIDEGTPWFNVLEQTILENSVEGIIQLESDPMKAEYDANEILNMNVNGAR
jgi:hypothetical protein